MNEVFVTQNQEEVLVSLYKELEKKSSFSVQHRNLDDASLAMTANGKKPIFTFRGILYYKTKAYRFSETFVDTSTILFATLTDDNSELYSEKERSSAAKVLKEVAEEVTHTYSDDIIRLYTATSNLKTVLNALSISTLDYYQKKDAVKLQ